MKGILILFLCIALFFTRRVWAQDRSFQIDIPSFDLIAIVILDDLVNDEPILATNKVYKGSAEKYFPVPIRSSFQFLAGKEYLIFIKKDKDDKFYVEDDSVIKWLSRSESELKFFGC